MTVQDNALESLIRKAKSFFPEHDPGLPGLVTMFRNSDYARIKLSPGIDATEIRTWCQDNFGDNWFWAYELFYFKNSEDATLFALKWIK